MNRDPFDELRRYARDLEAEVPLGRAEQRAMLAIRASRTPRRPRRAVVALATAGLMGIGNAALATAANPAVPGDALYGVDRAYEQIGDLVGLGGTHTAERFDEAGVLIAEGRATEALELVQQTLAAILASDDPQAAVDELIAQGNPDAASRVTDLLAVARDVDPGSVDGRAVAVAARNLIDQVQLPEQANGTTGGPSEPGPPDEVTTPDDPGGGPPTDPGPPTDNPGLGSGRP